MDETRRAWDEVGEGFAEFGRTISEGYRQLGEQEPRARPIWMKVPWPRRCVVRPISSIARSPSLGTLRDDDARNHVRDTIEKFSEALKVTSAVSDEVRCTVGGRQRPPPDSRQLRDLRLRSGLTADRSCVADRHAAS
jgi:hypothetical protein